MQQWASNGQAPATCAAEDPRQMPPWRPARHPPPLWCLHLARTGVLVRSPTALTTGDRTGRKRKRSIGLAVDLGLLRRYEAAFASDAALLRDPTPIGSDEQERTTEEGHRFGVRGFASAWWRACEGENDQRRSRANQLESTDRLGGSAR